MNEDYGVSRPKRSHQGVVELIWTSEKPFRNALIWIIKLMEIASLTLDNPQDKREWSRTSDRFLYRSIGNWTWTEYLLIKKNMKQQILNRTQKHHHSEIKGLRTFEWYLSPWILKQEQLLASRVNIRVKASFYQLKTKLICGEHSYTKPNGRLQIEFFIDTKDSSKRKY